MKYTIKPAKLTAQDIEQQLALKAGTVKLTIYPNSTYEVDCPTLTTEQQTKLKEILGAVTGKTMEVS